MSDLVGNPEDRFSRVAAQLEGEALKEKDYSKAAKRLLFLMFTEEEKTAYSRAAKRLLFLMFTEEERMGYSRAAKRLLFLMLTEEERTGRCLVDYKKYYKTTGATIRKCGLADQQKLTALQG